MTQFELTLRGFNGETDSTDHLILWVSADMTEIQIKDYLTREGLLGSEGVVLEVYAIPDITDDDQPDFELPWDLYELKAKAVKLVRDHENPMASVIETLLVAADNHAEDAGESDHAVGDLQGLLRKAWEIMSIDQRLQLLKSSEVADLLEVGGREEIDCDSLVEKFSQAVVDMETKVLTSGYAIVQSESGFYWETDDAAGEDWHSREDAIASAYEDLLKHTAAK